MKVTRRSASVAAATTVLILCGASSALAAPSAADAKDKAERAAHQLEVVTERFNTARETFAASSAAAAQASKKKEAADAALMAARAQVRSVARVAYTGTGLTGVQAVLTAPSLGDLISRMGTLQSVADFNGAAVRTAGQAATDAEQASAAASKAAADAKANADSLAAQEKKLTTQVAQFQATYEQLSAQEQAAAARAAQEAIAQRPPATPRTGDGPARGSSPQAPSRKAPAAPGAPAQRAPSGGGGGGGAHDWSGVAQCESGGNWKINTGNGFYGGLQFTASTWAAFGGTAFAPRADLASISQQITVAERVLAGQGVRAWPVCGKRLTGGTTTVQNAPAASVTPKPLPPPVGGGGSVVQAAMAKLGSRYVWAAAGPNTFDCSGLTQFAFRAAGISLPHSSAMQSRMGTSVSRGQAQAGDLVFFYSPVSHVGIYLGGGQMVHAPDVGDVVKVASVDKMGAPPVFRRV